MIRFNIKNYDYVDSKISGEVQRFRINAPDEKSTFAAGKGKWGLLDWRGEELVRAIYDKINPFKEHLALTKKGKKYGYLDDKGRIAVDFIYENGTDFKNGVALVEKSGTSFYIDYLGEKIKKPKFKNEDENKAEIIPFRKDSPLWYKKISNSFDNKLSGSFASVSYFKENEEGNFVKFKTKAAADNVEQQKRTVVQLFLLCGIAFLDSGTTIVNQTDFENQAGDFNCAAIEVPDNIKTLNINLATLETIVKDSVKATQQLAQSISIEKIGSKLGEMQNKIATSLDYNSIETGMHLAKQLELFQKNYKNLDGVSIGQLVQKLQTEFFWVIQEMKGKKTLMIISTRLHNFSYKKISDLDPQDIPGDRQKVEKGLVPKNSNITYQFFKIPNYLMIFKKGWKLPSEGTSSSNQSEDQESSSN